MGFNSGFKGLKIIRFKIHTTQYTTNTHMYAVYAYVAYSLSA